jgi:transposase
MSYEKRKKPRSFTKEFKQGAVKMVVEQGCKQSEVARDLGLSQNVLSRWVLQYRADHEGAFPGKGKLKPEDERIRKLESELRRVSMERDILKKAIAYFAERPK